jgi:hypothetical protein
MVYEKKTFGAEVDKIKVNEQEQPTTIGLVAGRNEQSKTESVNRFASYAGNSSGLASKTKHANKASLSNIASEIKKQFAQFDKNPVVMETIKRMAALKKSMRLN